MGRIRSAQAFYKQEAEKKLLEQEVFKKRRAALRLEQLHSGSLAYQKKQLIQAIQFYEAYLKLLEEDRGVPADGLTPGMFDLKTELLELVTLSGVYWDLAKIYDRSQSSEKVKRFFHYLEKYVLFSKGLPFQSMCSESLRKYISYHRQVHREAFKNAYANLSVSRCFIATELIDVIQPDTFCILIQLRDEVLKKYFFTRGLIHIYYAVAPGLSRMIHRLPLRIRMVLGAGLDQIANYFSKRLKKH